MQVKDTDFSNILLCDWVRASNGGIIQGALINILRHKNQWNSVGLWPFLLQNNSVTLYRLSPPSLSALSLSPHSPFCPRLSALCSCISEQRWWCQRVDLAVVQEVYLLSHEVTTMFLFTHTTEQENRSVVSWFLHLSPILFPSIWTTVCKPSIANYRKRGHTLASVHNCNVFLGVCTFKWKIARV